MNKRDLKYLRVGDNHFYLDGNVYDDVDSDDVVKHSDWMNAMIVETRRKSKKHPVHVRLKDGTLGWANIADIRTSPEALTEKIKRSLRGN
jgi:hypothetical protein